MHDAETPDTPVLVPPPDNRGDLYAVLHNRDFVLYVIGRLAASFGQQMLTVAVGWELYERTHSAMALAYVGLTQMVPMILFTLPAGHVADNFNRRKIIMVMTLVAAVASLGLLLISKLQAPVGWTYACLFVAGSARTFLWPASTSFLPQLVPRKLFTRAVTWNTGAFYLSSVLGPPVGGKIIELTHHALSIYALNVGALLTCCTLIGLVRQQHIVAVREKLTLKNMLVGFNFVFSNKIILGTITLDLFAVLLGGATSLLPVYAKDILHAGPRGLGILLAAIPCGAILSAFVLAHRPPLEKAGRAMLWAVTIFGIGTIGFGLSKWFWFSFAMLFLCGAADNISVVVRQTLVQILTPDSKRGRVSAVNSLFIGTSNELGGFESGTVAHWLGPAIGNSIITGAMLSVVTGGVGTILVVIAVAWVWPEIRKYGRLDP